jgi:hypothetical protein
MRKSTFFLVFMLAMLFVTACSDNRVQTTQSISSVKLFISKDEFNSKYDKHREEKQFENADFQLMDGTRVKADFFSYEPSALFEYATAIFYKDELAFLYLETTLGIEQIQSILDMKFDEIALVEPLGHGYHITFDSMFHETNIGVYPYEWN